MRVALTVAALAGVGLAAAVLLVGWVTGAILVVAALAVSLTA